jgi:hypothetical protein
VKKLNPFRLAECATLRVYSGALIKRGCSLDMERMAKCHALQETPRAGNVIVAF